MEFIQIEFGQLMMSPLTQWFVVVEDGDYLDAKLVSKEIAAKLEGWQLEEAHNIARRDGIGSLILDAWNEIGRLPVISKHGWRTWSIGV